MDRNLASSRKIKSDLTLVRLLESLKDSEGRTITELADELELAKSTVHAHVHTLADEGYLVRTGDRFHLGLRLLDLGGSVQDRHLDELIRQKVDRLAIETAERAQFVVEERGVGLHIYCSYGENAVPTDVRIGRRFPLHISAAGKAILAYLPDERIDETLADDLVSFTEHTITDRDRVREELQRIREDEYAINQQESTRGLRAVGVPLRHETNGVIGAISVSGPTHRIKGDLLHDEIPDLILGIANEIELKLAFP
jgi:DNA-binding IclR family transcriptional regulator